MLASRHEAILQRSKTQGAGRRRRGKTQGEEVAQTFSVSVPTIKRWLKRRRETGDMEPKPIPGRPCVKGAELGEWLPSQLQNNSDLTLEVHCEAFEEELGVAVYSTFTAGRAIARLPGGGWPIKEVSHSYSADLNLIEEAFSKIKGIVRKAGARSREVLVEALDRALAAVTPEDAAGWFAHADYEPQDRPF